MANYDRNDYGYRGGQGRGGGFLDRAGNALRRGMGGMNNPFRGQSVGQDDHLRQDYENSSTMDAGGNYGNMNRGGGDTGNRGMWSNSWSDGAYTADAADRLDRDTDLGGNRHRDTSPFHGGYNNNQGMQSGNRGYNASQGYDRGYESGGTSRDHGWNLGGGEWGHNWSGQAGRSTGGMSGGGMGMTGGMSGGGMSGGNRGGGFIDRAQNAVRRGWEQVEDRFDGDDDRTMPYGATGGGRANWGTGYTNNDYDRDYGRGGMDRDTGMNRGYGAAGGYGGGMMGSTGGGDNNWDRGGHNNKSRHQVDAGDPFGDRQGHTPIRMVNGDYGNRFGGGQGRGYDNGYRGASGAGGIGNEPYYGNMNSDQYDNGYRGQGRDRDWF